MITIHELFRGLERAHGIYNIPKTTQKQKKVSGNAITVLAPVTEELWQKHIDGKQGLGIVPINDNNACFFGAIDVDIYDLNLKELEKNIRDTPLILCRTKSGGAHLYIFFSEEVEAKDVRFKLLEYCALLGFIGSEIFPKQEKLAGHEDVGNWINMPYFNGDNTERYAIKNGRKLALKSFLKYAHESKLDHDALVSLKILDIDDELQGSPPCLKALATQGVPEGTRNSAMFNFLVYLRNRYNDNWQEHVDDVNKYMSPPLGNKEVSVILKSVGKKEYFYTCKQQPIISFCNKELCRKCEFGIGYGVIASVIELGKLTKIQTDPPIWFIVVNDVRIQLTTDDMLRQDRFRKLCVEKINFQPSRIKAKQWEEMINDRLANVELVEAPADSGPIGMFEHYLRQFCMGPAQANTKEDILSGKVWTDKGRSYFRSADLIAFLDRQKFRYFDGRKIWSLLKDSRDAGHSEFKLKGVKTRVWNIVSFDEINSDLDVPETENRI